MTSPTRSESAPAPRRSQSVDEKHEEDATVTPIIAEEPSQHKATTPEPPIEPASHEDDTASTPGQLAVFDWEDFEARYENALREGDEQEQQILQEAESLSKFFRVWASSASAHDDERAVKRLRTRQRFVNLAEERVAQKERHYEDVVRAFESALALLQTK